MPQFLKYPLQRGQAMVEYAIILIVMTLLVAGGLELAIAAYNGYATIEAAKAGASEWSEYLARASYDNSSANFAPRDSDKTPVGLGDHQDLANFRQPSCDPDGFHYDDGLPDGSITPEEASITQGGDKVYLFNPLPIDITNCTGNDADYPNRSRISVLVSGKKNDPDTVADEVDFDGLPRLNRAMYSQYEVSYFDPNATTSTTPPASGPAFISSSDYHDSPAGKSRLMRLPGWLDPSDPNATSWLVHIKVDPDTQLQTAEAKPVFHLKCATPFTSDFRDCDSEGNIQNVCWTAVTGSPTPLACNVQVQYRYRHVFESLVMMGVGIGFGPGDTENEIVQNIDPLLMPYFTDRPVGEDEIYPTDTPTGILGGEAAVTEHQDDHIRALSSRLKARKDFIGCYETFNKKATAVEELPVGSPVSMTWAAGSVTVNLPGHGLANNDLVLIEYSDPGDFNGSYSVEVTSADEFTYPKLDDPGSYVGDATVKKIVTSDFKVFDVNVVKSDGCAFEPLLTTFP